MHKLEEEETRKGMLTLIISPSKNKKNRKDKQLIN